MNSEKKYLSVKEIKLNARNKILDGLGTVALLTLMYFCLSSALTVCQSLYAVENNNVISLIFSLVITFLFSALSGIVKYGYASYFLKFTNNVPVGVREIFAGFTHSPDKTIFVSMFLTILNYLFLVPYAVFSFAFPDLLGKYNILLRLGVYLLCSVGYFIFSLRYAPVYFLLNDLPGKRAIEILMISKWLMKKNKRRLFALLVSFIPIYILGLLSCFTGMLWILPYLNIAECYFYQDISSVKSA